jgi:TetR/AcrR family transcriptional regulator, transcriptional repressor of bet genes
MARNEPIRDQRRRDLILATVAVIARHGYAGTTVSRVAKKAGVSVGLVNFHFHSKERLVRETFRHLSAEYDLVWRQNLAAADDEPQARLEVMIRTYFDPQIFTREKLPVWFTFWSDAELRDRYRAAALRVERLYLREIEAEIARLLGDGEETAAQDKAGRAGTITAALSAMIDGFWLQFMLHPANFDRRAAIETCLGYLRQQVSPLADPGAAR